MLLHSFYTLLNHEIKDGVIHARVKIDASHSIFNGHFPGNPVTPGVVQVEMVKEIVNEIYGHRYVLSAMSNCKFLKIWNPLNYPEISFVISTAQTEEGLKVNATGEEQGITFFKLSAIYV